MYSLTVEMEVKYILSKSAFFSEEKQKSFWPDTEKEFRGDKDEEVLLILTKWWTTFQNCFYSLEWKSEKESSKLL